MNAVRLRALPVGHPEQLAYIDFAQDSWRAGWHSTRNARFTSDLWQQVRDQQQAFSGVIAWSASRFNLAKGGEARYAEGLYVSGNFYQVLEVPAIIGRTFTPEDDKAGCPSPSAVISAAFWEREFASDPGILNRVVSLEGRNFPIIGVSTPSFFGVEVGNRYDVAVPLCVDAVLAEDGKGRAAVAHGWWLAGMGRLKPGWTAERASAHVRALSPGIMQAAMPPSYRPNQVKQFLNNKLVVTPGATGISGLRRRYESPLWILLATTGAVLLDRLRESCEPPARSCERAGEGACRAAGRRGCAAALDPSVALGESSSRGLWNVAGSRLSASSQPRLGCVPQHREQSAVRRARNRLARIWDSRLRSRSERACYSDCCPPGVRRALPPHPRCAPVGAE